MTVALGVSLVVSAALVPAFMVATGALVGSIPDAVRDGLRSAAGRRLVWAVAATAGAFVTAQVLAPMRLALAESLGRRVDGAVRGRLIAAAMRPYTTGHLEDDAVRDEISMGRSAGPFEFTAGKVVVGWSSRAQERLAGILSALIVARFSDTPLAAVLVAAWVFLRIRFASWLFASFRILLGQTQILRRADYHRELATTPPAAKETRIFGLGGFLVDRFTAEWTRVMTGVWRQRRRGAVPIGLATLAVGVVYAVAFVLVGRAAIHGSISVGELTAVAQAMLGLDVLTNISTSDVWVEYGSACLPATRSVERRAAALPDGAGAPPGMVPAREIAFDHVAFTYPGGARPVYEDLTLRIEAGRSLAIVGANGAGKTTLVKLLARFHEPTSGRILADGIDIATLDAVAWQRRIAAIFQDFVRYELPAADNVAFGAAERIGDLATVSEAADLAGAAAIVDALPGGWDAVLSRRFDGGVDLSGGQWQRIALARALLAVRAGAGVLVLDEPTANLDVRAEAELFDRFLELTRGLTTILISHRFSTVRRAERIVVLEDGRIAEHGTHQELLASGGIYAHMFRLQAARFADA